PIVRLKYERIACPFTDLSLQLVRSTIFRYTFRPLSPFPCPRSARSARLLHHVTTDFITHNTRGNLVTRKVPVIVSDPGETFVLIEQEVGSALRAASPLMSASAASAKYRCKLTFFHDSQHFGFSTLSVCEILIQPSLNSLFPLLGPTSYPRLYTLSQIPRQTELNTSPATLFIDGKMHHLVLDGTPDSNQSQIFPVLPIFAENANATRRNLVGVLDQLKDM
ncbi:hypothetical protein N7524_004723, partial [Penicillium chrysogenum]